MKFLGICSMFLGFFLFLSVPVMAYSVPGSGYEKEAYFMAEAIILGTMVSLFTIGAAMLVFNIWMAVIAFQLTEHQYSLINQSKNTWVITGILAWFIGFGVIWAIFFFFMINNKKQEIEKKAKELE